MKTLEKDIQKAILDYLGYRNVFHWRNNTTAVYDPKRHAFRRMNTMAGVPDIICIIKGRFVGIECKSSTGKQNDDQKQFEIKCLNNGGVYCLARCVEDVEKMLKDVM